MTSSTKHPWTRALEILRWRGPGHFLLLALRELLRPLLYWYAWNVYLTDLRKPLAPPYGRGQFDVRIFCGEKDRDEARARLEAVGEPMPANFETRIQRGDALAIVYSGSEPVACGWMTFTSGMELAFGTNWILHPREGTHYGAFVLPRWRGHGIFSVMNVALNTYAQEHGIERSVGTISVLNSQSLSMARKLGKARIMTVVVIRVRGLGWTFRKAFGAPFHTRFTGKAVDLGYAVRGNLGVGDKA